MTAATGRVRRRDAGRIRASVPVLAALSLVLVAVAVGLSPLALGTVGAFSDDWEGLSLIGQTYGAASAVLAGLALAGVAATLVAQTRETRVSRELAVRDSTSELLRMAMDNPEYAECWGANLTQPTGRAQRQSMYTNMIVSQWEMAYETRSVGEDHVRALAHNLFAGRVGWEFWSRARTIRLRTAETRRSRRFHRILDEEFQRSPEPRKPTQPRNGPPRRWGAARPLAGVLIVGAVAAGMAAVRRVLNRRA